MSDHAVNFFFWFITLPLTAFYKARDFGPWGIFFALLEACGVFFGGLIGWYLLNPASPLFNVIVLVLAYFSGLALTHKLEDDPLVVWSLILLLSGFILQKFVFWLTLIY